MNTESDDDVLEMNTESDDDVLEMNSDSDNGAAESDSSAAPDSPNIDESALFEGSPFTNIEACLFLMTVFFKCGLTRECLGQILFAFATLLPSSNTLPSTTFMFFKVLSRFQRGRGMCSHFFCSKCNEYLEQNATHCPCCNEPCHSKGSFLQMKLADTLRSFLEDDKIYKYFIKPTSSASDKPIEDIVDGAMYQSQPACSSKFNFSLFWNTDGVQVFKSSGKSLWPLHCTIPELPPLMRKKFQILTCLWFGVKPVMNTFMKPFCMELMELATSGLAWRHPETGKTIISYITAPVSSVDAVARAMLQGIRQFNGLYGCSFCEHPGKSLSLPGKGHVHVYLPGSTYSLRNGHRMQRQAAEALENGHPVKGVKGPTVLSLIPEFDCGSGFVVDYMHCVLLGVVRTFLHLWFDSKYHGESWYMGRQVEVVDKKLLAIKPPDYITRTPRSLKHRCYWKASELRAWLLFYSFPALHQSLPDVYFDHFALLVGAVYLLLSESVSVEDIDISERLLLRFVYGVKNLYGERFCSFNVHQLTHIADSVRNWGPLWSTSAFLFENRNGELMRLVKGTQAVEKQLASLVAISNALSVIQNRVGDRLHVDFVLSKLENLHFTRVSSNGIAFHGRPCQTSGAVRTALGSFFSNREHVYVYKKVTMGTETFSSVLCINQKRRNNFTVMYVVERERTFALIQCFAKYAGQVYMVINKLLECGVQYRPEGTGFSIPHIIAVKQKDHLDVIPVPPKMTKCVKVLDFVCISPNSYELNL
ncbi:uncharacterized protein LOC115330680 [Ixodes scapularis]|uniref:uncharacterized protein LOC115330680 n=1 Tax=Ixodes scapularis TaxID=6945 RepID=UPI001A9F8444|nr:uncharacterized protein LOC115330680 [Ixodes scapularis]